MLINLGWETNECSPKCNVFTERTKTIEQNKKLFGKQPDYVLYQSGTDKPIAIIEAKREGENLSKALEQAITLYAEPLGVHIIFITDGTLTESFDRRAKSSLKLDGQAITDFISEKMLLRFHIEGATLFSPEKISYTKRELIKIFSDANDLLREEGIREGIERFTEFSNLLFLKLISEIEDDRELNGEKRRLEKKYCWDAFCSKTGEEMLDYINKIILPRLVDKYNHMDKYNHSGDVFQSELKIKNPENLKSIIDNLSVLKLLDADSDVKGDAFEYFLKNSVSVGTDLGEYFTPRHIVKLITDLVDPKFGEKVYDPCCGTGGFLIQAFRHIKKKVKLTPESIQTLEQNTVWGREITGTAKVAKMNMIIIGGGHTNINQMDSLMNPVTERFEVVMTNFPFSQKTKYSHYYGFTTRDANPVFLKHVIDSLKNEGRAGVVVPDGLLFDVNSEYIKLRQILLEKCNLMAVIQLDPFVFKPYTGQPTNILIFEKGKPTKNVWFFNVINDGYKKTGSIKGRPSIDENDLPLLRDSWIEKRKTVNSFSVDIETIKNNNYKLTLNSYKDRKKRTVDIKTLRELCEPPIIGGTPPRDNMSYWHGDNLWVKISDMADKEKIDDTEEKISDEGIHNSSAKKIASGTLLFSFKLTVGKTAIAGKDLFTNEAIAALIPKDKTDPNLSRYLYYILPTLDYSPYAQRATKGFTLNSETILDIEIPYPDPEIRKKIVMDGDKKELERLALIKKISDLIAERNEFIKINTS
jgi:type I restriction enzyme M protein